MTSGSTGTYVYGVIAARRRPALSRVGRGLPGTGRVRLIDVAPQRYLVVSDAPLDRFGEDALPRLLADFDWVSRAAIAHETVAEAFLRADALVPMKPFTIFTSDDRAVQEVRAQWRRIERDLVHVTRRVEWGVRMTFDERRASAAAAPERRGLAVGNRAPDLPSGRNYLLAKHRQRVAATTQLRRARASAAALFKSLAASAVDARRRPPAAPPTSGGRLLLDAAFLVAAAQSAKFRAAVSRQARSLAPAGFNLQLTGPWPPYSFVKDA